MRAPFLLKVGDMNAVPSLVFLFAALGCSVVGRAMLVGAAFGVGPGWGISVILVPFAPFFFRLSYPELAQRSRYWRLATVPLTLLFFITGGSTSLSGFRFPNAQKLLPAVPPFANIPPKQKPVAADPIPSATAATPAIDKPTDAPKEAAPAVAAVTDPARPVALATPTPPTLTAAERLQANRRQFEMIAEWYARLKNERGYLLKSDTAGIDAYNVEAAKYQAALQQAKAEQAEVARLMAKK